MNRKMTRPSSDFVNQMYNLVKSMAHPAGFEPTACRLGVGEIGFFRSSAKVCEVPGRLIF